MMISRLLLRHRLPLPGVYRPLSFRSFGCFRNFSSDSCQSKSSTATGSPADSVWTLQSFRNDHYHSLFAVPKAFMANFNIDPYISESIYVTVNSVNNCPYCTGLHGNLARMAGVDSEKLQSSSSVEDARTIVDEPAITYARAFAEHGNDSKAARESFQEISNHYGPKYASQVDALCWLLKWGSFGGNTINSILSGEYSKKYPGTLPFQVTTLIYYGPLFAAVAVLNKLLDYTPKVPKAVSAGLGVGVVVIVGTWITPIGLISVATQTGSLVNKK